MERHTVLPPHEQSSSDSKVLKLSTKQTIGVRSFVTCTAGRLIKMVCVRVCALNKSLKQWRSIPDSRCSTTVSIVEADYITYN